MAATKADPSDLRLVRQVAAGLANMAVRSSRGQADLGAVLRKDGITLLPEQRDWILKTLSELGIIQDVISLDDGDVLLTMTHKGMQREFDP